MARCEAGVDAVGEMSRQAFRRLSTPSTGYQTKPSISPRRSRSGKDWRPRDVDRRVVSLRAATLVRMSALTFNVVYEDAGKGWVYAHVSELPEVQTQGEGLDDARAMVKDAIALVLEERRARGEAIPKTGWALVEAVEIAA
jgi:predicted RNase H-like HicB family nuclease